MLALCFVSGDAIYALLPERAVPEYEALVGGRPALLHLELGPVHAHGDVVALGPAAEGVADGEVQDLVDVLGGHLASFTSRVAGGRVHGGYKVCTVHLKMLLAMLMLLFLLLFCWCFLLLMLLFDLDFVAVIVVVFVVIVVDVNCCYCC